MPEENKRTSRMAVWSMIFSALFVIPILPLVGLIFGIIALVRIKKNQNLKGEVFAIIGIVLGMFMSMMVMVGFLAYLGLLSP